MDDFLSIILVFCRTGNEFTGLVSCIAVCGKLLLLCFRCFAVLSVVVVIVLVSVFVSVSVAVLFRVVLMCGSVLSLSLSLW